MSDIFYTDSASFQTFEVTNTATINNVTINGDLSVSRAIIGTSSYALTSSQAISSSYVSTIKTNPVAVYYPIFVDSNNSSVSYEQLYTDANAFLIYNPGTGTLTSKIFASSNGDINPITASVAITASFASTASLAPNYVLNSATSSFVQNSQTSSFITNSQTSSFVLNSQTSSFVLNSQTSSMTVATASYVTGSIFTSTNRALSASNALTASRVILSNGSAFSIQYGGGPSGNLLTGSTNLQYNGTNLTLTNGKILQSDGTNYYTYIGSYGTANETGMWGYDLSLDNYYPITSYAIATNKYYFAGYNITYDPSTLRLGVNTASPSTTLHVAGNTLITTNLTIGSSSVGSNENTLILGPAPAGGNGEGGQILLQAPNSGGYTSASMFDNYQNQTRLLRGNNSASDAVVAQWNMHTKQMQIPTYNSTNAFPASASVAKLAVDNNGNVVTMAKGFATQLDLYSALGSTTKAEPVFAQGGLLGGGGQTMASQTLYGVAIQIPQQTTITGVRWYRTATGGVYTANNYNGVGLYSYSGGTLTLVASSSNDGTIWSSSYAGTNTFATKSFANSYVASPGIYFATALYCSSAQTTAPIIGTGPAAVFNANVSLYDYTNSAKHFIQTAANITTFASSVAISSYPGSLTQVYLALY